MNPTEKQWLLWVGKLYQDIVDSEQPADSIITARMRVEGRRWGHDARRWVSATAYSLVRSRIRTLWFWAAGVSDFEPLRRAALALKTPIGPAGAFANDFGTGGGNEPPVLVPPPIPFVSPGALKIADSVSLGVLPSRFALAAERLRARSQPAVPEVVVAWVARRPGSPLDQLARSFGIWLENADLREVLQALAEGCRRPCSPEAVGALLEWSARCVDRPPTDGSDAEDVSWTYSVPLWLAARWCGILGREETLRLAEVFEQPAPIYLRVNGLKATADQVLESLRSEKYLVDKAEEVPGALIVVHRANLYRSQAFNDGLYEVQDVSSQVVALALDPKPGERVLDYCAGAGGKTLHIASLLGNKGLLWALDVDARRLTRLRTRAARGDAYNVRRGLLDPFSPAQLREVWEGVTKVAIEDTDYPYSATLSPGDAAAMMGDGNTAAATDGSSGSASTPIALSDSLSASDSDSPVDRSSATSSIPPEMRAALGLSVPDFQEARAAEEAAATDGGGAKAKAIKYKDRKANDLPEPTEEEKQKLRDALASMPQEFDAVLVDAPCTGTGTCRRRPDFGWRVTPRLVEEQLRDQAAILRTAARFVRPGGRLLYATCSILPDENENQVLSFLADHPEFEPANLADTLGRHGLAHWLPPGGTFWMTLLPSRRPGDGFFIALMRRKGEDTTAEVAV